MTLRHTDPLSEQLAEERLADLEQRRAAQRRRYYARRPKRVDNVIAQLMQRKGYAQIRAAGEREQAWQAALAKQGSERWAESTRVASLRRGVLEVQVGNSLLMQELTFCKESLLASLQEALPEEGVRQLRFRAGTIF